MAAGNVVQYTYDAAGNIVQVTRQSTSGLVITSVNPGSGSVGSVVSILGSGFSATPPSNTVKFNGTTGTVSAADTGSLSVTVPAGATTGRITVQVGANTATSPLDFVVVVPGAPTISSFSPASGASGITVTVTGTNFSPGGSVSTKLNANSATSSVASSTSLSFTVPANTGSGRISITNPVGTGISPQDFIVPPSGFSASDFAVTLRLALGASGTNLSLGIPSKSALLLFDGQQDTYYTVQFDQFGTSPTVATVTYKVFRPDNTLLVTGNIGYGARPTIHLPKLPSTGTYSVTVSPGVATLTSFVKVAADPVLAVDGSPATASLDMSETARVAFTASANQYLGAGLTNFTLTPSVATATAFNVFLPDGSALSAPYAPYCTSVSGSNPQGNCDGEFKTTVAGTYTMIGTPPAGYRTAFGVQFSSEVTGTLSIDTPQTFNLTRVGQDARFTFTGAVGDSLAVDLSGIVPQPQAQSFNVAVDAPSGSTINAASAQWPAFAALLQLGTLTTSGTYTVRVDPAYGAYGTGRLTVKQGTLLATTDAATLFSTTAAAESARFRFQATAGQNLSVAVASFAYGGTSSTSSYLTIYKPDGSSLTYDSCSPTTAGGRCKVNLFNVPVTGTYSVAITPPGGVTVSGNITLSAEQTGTLANNTSVALTVSRSGQNVRYSFPGTAGQSTAIELAQLVTTPAAQTVYVYLYKADGTYVTSTSTSTSGAYLNLGSLPSTTTYYVLLDCRYGAPYTTRLTLDSGTALSVDGATQSLSTTVDGETLRYTFSGTSGSLLDLALSGLTYSPTSSTNSYLTLYKPDGNSLIYNYCYPSSPGGGCELGTQVLPSTGTYSILLAPPAGILITGGTLAVSSPAAGSLTIGGGSQTVTIARPGQTARYTFSGTGAQLLRLNWSATSLSPTNTSVAVTVLKPDGSTLSSASFANAATGGMDIASLPTTGTYTIVFDPTYAATMAAPVTLVTR